MVETVRKGYVEQKYPRFSLSVLLAATSIFFSISGASSQENSDGGMQDRRVTAIDSPFVDTTQLSEIDQPLSELLPDAFSQLQTEFRTNHPESTGETSIASYYHQQASLESGSLLSDHTYQKLVTLETFAALSGVLLPDPYYQTPRFRQREQNLVAALSNIQNRSETQINQPASLNELLILAAQLSQLSEFGIYLRDFATIEQNGHQQLLHTTQETQVASIGISFMSRHFLSAVQRQQLFVNQPLPKSKWLMAMIDSFAYFEGLKAMNPYSGAQTDERYAAHLENEVTHFSQFNDYTLSSISAMFQYEFERLVAEEADPFPVGISGQAVPYTFYTYPASDSHAQGFDPLNLPSNVLFGQKFEDGSAFIIYSSGESRAGLTIYDKLAIYQSRYLPTFEDWWGSMPQKAQLAFEILPAARIDENNRLAAALMNIPFARLYNYAAGDLSSDTDELYSALLSDSELGFEEIAAGKQKIAFLLLMHRCNPVITHPVLQRDSNRYQFDLRAELFDPLFFQQDVNEKYEQNVTENEIPLAFLPLNKMRTMSTFQRLLDFGIVPTTYQHASFELQPELLAIEAEYLITWLENGSIILFQVDEKTQLISGIEIDVQGNVKLFEDQVLPDLRMENMFAVPGR